MAGPGAELDWHFNYWNEEMAEYATGQLGEADTILLGRVTYNAMAKYWPFVATNITFPREDVAFADLMNTHRKVVFSTTLETTNWNNTLLSKKITRKNILNLKKLPGKNMIIFGSGSLVNTLMKWKLVDEYALWVHPVILGHGKPLFAATDDPGKLKPLMTKTFSSGVVLTNYRV